MIKDIKGLHHVTSMASDARQNNNFFTDTLGLRRVKKTVNFDAPDVYHLYYGDEVGTPGSFRSRTSPVAVPAPVRWARRCFPSRKDRSATGRIVFRRPAWTA